MRLPPKIIKIQPCKQYRLKITYSNGEVRVYDVDTGSWSGVFAPLKNVSFFNQVALKNRTATWPNGVDISPEELYQNSYSVK